MKKKTIDAKEKTMNKVSFPLLGRPATFARMMGSGLVLSSLALSGCGGAQAEGADQVEEFVRVINVEVTAVQPETFVETINLTGTVQANQDVTVSAEESGVVREILEDKGRWVEEGQKPSDLARAACPSGSGRGSRRSSQGNLGAAETPLRG